MMIPYLREKYSLRKAVAAVCMLSSLCVGACSKEKSRDERRPTDEFFHVPQPTDKLGEKLGLSLWVDETQTKSGIVVLSCKKQLGSQERCDPVVGDTACSTMQPVLCILPLGLRAPKGFEDSSWSGGVVASTSDVLGSSFETIADVDQLCVATFGDGWRTATFHDAGGWNLRAYGNVEDRTKKHWIDIQDQPQSNCWQRNLSINPAPEELEK